MNLRSLVVFTAIIRGFFLLLFVASPVSSQATELFWNDPWHHYHVGLAILLFVGLARAMTRRVPRQDQILALGLAFILDEYSVILFDLGLNRGYHGGIMYLSDVDSVFLGIIVGMITLGAYAYSVVWPSNSGSSANASFRV